MKKVGSCRSLTVISKLILIGEWESNRQVRREVTMYNLDMILAVRYQSTSSRAVQFRQWATSVLSEY
ncbi:MULTISPECIES: RhuM family protein [Bifidobacterium]|uniref:RhuM family protein n=1 Tax=Bifidobacterium TaxID=1678 RepID=UPI0034D1548E